MLVKNSYINILSNVISASIGFLTSIMVVRVFGVNVIGKIAYMTGLVGLMTFVVDLGIDQTALKYMAEKKDDFTKEFATYFIGSLEGGILLARIQQDRSSFDVMTRPLLVRLEEIRLDK